MVYGQVVFNGILAAAVIALTGAGFALILSTGRFFHFAHGAVFAASGYFFLLLTGLPLIPRFAGTVVLAAALGGVCELLVYRPLRRRGAGSVALLIASLGLFLIFQNLISLTFGDEARMLRSNVVVETLTIAGVRATHIQVTTIWLAVGLILGLAIVQRVTRYGRVLRAVANDAELACAFGVNVDRVILWSVVLGSVLAGAAGVLVGLDSEVRPTMGMRPLLLGVVAAIVGGPHRTFGVALGALLLGISQQWAAWVLPVQWQDAIVFAVLLAFLVFRPQGVVARGASAGVD